MPPLAASRPVRLLLPLLLLALVRGAPAAAASPQEPAVAPRLERPAGFDSGGHVQLVGPDLRRQLSLWSDLPDFVEARLWRGDDGVHVLEVEYRLAGAPARQRRSLTPTGLDSLRGAFDRHLAGRTRGNGYDHSGRGELLFDSIVLGLAVYGPTAPVVLGVHGSRPGVAAYMLTSSAAFYLPYRLTRHRDVTRAHRQLTQYGATRGFVAGLLLKHMIMGGGEPNAYFRFANGASVAAAWAGFRAVDGRGYSHGQAELAGVMGDFGLATGGGLATVAGWYDNDGTARAGHGLVLASGAAGLWLGQRLGQRRHYTRGDAYILRAGGIAGALATLPFVDATGTRSARAFSGALVAGEVAGAVLTDRWLASRDYTFGDGLIASGGEIAGALLCMGLTYLADTGGDFDSLAYTTAAAAGSAGGFALTLRFLSPR